MVHERLDNFTNGQVWHIPLLPKIQTSLVSIEQLNIDQLKEIIHIFRVGTLQLFFRKLNTMVHERLVTYTTLQIQKYALLSKQIHRQYRQTVQSYISSQKLSTYSGLETTNNFSKITKSLFLFLFILIENRKMINRYLCMLVIVIFQDPYLHKDIHFLP